jgi:hypothetical protein
MTNHTHPRQYGDFNTSTRASSDRGASTAVYLLVLGVLAVLILVAILLERSTGPADEGTRPSTPGEAAGPADGDLLDPDPYREQIRALEAVLYREGAADAATGSHVVYAARRLADAVHTNEAEPLATEASQEILAFAADIDQSDHVGFATLDLPAARASWAQVRGRLFVTAQWFAGLETSAGRRVVRAGPGAGGFLAANLRRLSDQVADLITAGREETAGFGEIGVDVPEPSEEAAQLRSDWADWSRDWDRRVNALATVLPPSPAAGASSELVLAHQGLANVVHALRLLPTTTSDVGIPSPRERQERFDAADSTLQQARERLMGID